METKLKTTFFNTSFKSWIMTLILSMSMLSCLPAQKKTQCGENEAFNATKRKCVPVIGASTSNTVFIGSKFPSNSYSISKSAALPQTHTVAVSDVYGYGFTVDWFVHASGSTSTIPQLQGSVTFPFYPSNFGPGTYIIEAIVYDEDGINQLDSTTWNVIVENLAAPTLTSASPAGGAISYLNTITTTRTHSVVISSPDLEDGNYYIYQDGVLAGQGPFNAATTLVSHNFIPANLSNGLHTIEVKIFDGNTTTPLFDSYTWLVNIIDPVYPVIQPIAAGSVPKLTQTITVVDGVTFSGGPTTTDGGWTNPSTVALESISPTNSGLCVEFDNVDKLNPMGVPDITVVMSVNGIDFEPDAQRVGTTNVFCASVANINNAQTYFNLSNPDVAEARTITVKTYAIGTTNLIEALSWNVAVRPTNIRPVISIDGALTSPALGCTATNAVTYTGCTLTQSVNNNRDSNDYDYDDVGLDSTSILASEFAINLDYDPDIQARDHYEVIFQLKPAGSGSWENIDELSVGAQTNSPTSNYTYSDCTYSASDLRGDKLICKLRMDAFNNNGPLPGGAYILRAYIRDAGPGTGLGGGGTPKESNIITWDLNVIENQDTGSISIASFVNTGVSAASQPYFINGEDRTVTEGLTYTESFANSSPSSDIAESIGTEKLTLTINSLVRDTQRDKFSISVSVDNGLLGGQTSLQSTTVEDRVDNREWVRAQTTVILPEWIVTGAASSSINFYVTVQDRPDSYTPVCTTCASDTEILTLTINNTNPAPTFNDGNGAVDLAGFKAFAGQPFTVPFTTASYMDASVYDGNNITWKWQVSTDGGTIFNDIPNADSDNQVSPALVWTPNHDIPNAQDIQLQLCIGDDGFGVPNDVSTCVNAKRWINLTAYQATSILARSDVDTSSGNELSNWFDDTSNILYTAYTSGTTIYVEKQKFNSVTSAYETVHSISFPTEDNRADETPVIAEGLSIDGDEGKALIIAYKVTQAVTNIPQYRIRRIDITNEKLNFNYCGFYNLVNSGSHTDCINYDNFASEALNNANFTASSPRQLIVDFTNVPSGSVSFITNAGVTVSFNFGASTNLGSNIVGFCNPSATCSDATLSAIAFRDAINNSAGVTASDSAAIYALSQEIFAEVSGTTVTITGSNEFDYYDENSASVAYVGNVKVIGSTGSKKWVLPYADAGNNLKIKIASGLGLEDDDGLNATAPSASSLLLAGTGTNNREIAQVELGASLYIGTVNSIGNMSLYKIDSGAYALQNTATNVFTSNSYQSIESLSIDAQNVGGTERVIASAISLSSGGARDLSMAIFNATNLSVITETQGIDANGFEQFVENLDRVKVITDPTTLGSSFVTLTTTSTSINPNSAYMIKVNNPSGSFIFQPYNYPKLNINDVVPDSAIAVSPVVNLTAIGHLNAPITTATGVAPGADDGVLNPLFFSFHEADTGDKVRSGFIHTDTTSITTNSTAVSGNFPGFIGNN